MAIWPFGRKNKRHTIQVDSPGPGDTPSPQEPRHSFEDPRLGRKPSRKHSKRQKNRHSHPVEDFSSSIRDASPAPHPIQYPPPTSHSEQVHFMGELRDPPSRIGRHSDGYASRSTVHQEQPSMSRNPSARRSRRNENGPAVLKKRLSKRKAYEIAREREIRMLSSTPIDIPPRRSTPLPNEQYPGDNRNRVRNQRSDRHLSDVSLTLRDSAASSLSEYAESYKYKVNAFAAWTPRPVIRYVEAPRLQTARTQRTTDSNRRERTPAVSASEENLFSKKRIDRLADDLDAGALRELLDRDRRRMEKKQVDDQDKAHRKLNRAAERQKSERDLTGATDEPQTQPQNMPEPPQERPDEEARAESDHAHGDRVNASGPNTSGSGDVAGSWLQDTSKDGDRNQYESMESVHVIGNIDDSSIRERKLGMRRSFAPSQDMGMSRSTLSPSHSPSRRGVNSPNSSQLYGLGRESTSDVSRTVDSERRLSDHSSGRVNTISSIFRRGSSRLKRRYRERFQDRSPEPPSNASHESFFKAPTPSSAPAQFVPPKSFLRTGTIKRSQSKFTEHFGDEPLSPPDSRLQSPDIPEEPADLPESGDEQPKSSTVAQQPIPVPGARDDRHRSWAGEILEEDDNIPLSQSLASIDSEGSWMSGQFLRRISQKNNNPLRPSVNSSRNKLDSPSVEEAPESEKPGKSGPSAAESNVPGEKEQSFVMPPEEPEAAEETWHDHIAKRPVLVTPTVRPRSNEGMLNNVQSLSPISADAEFGPIPEHSAEILDARVEDEQGH